MESHDLRTGTSGHCVVFLYGQTVCTLTDRYVFVQRLVARVVSRERVRVASASACRALRAMHADDGLERRRSFARVAASV